jgi:hypothetical protein
MMGRAKFGKEHQIHNFKLQENERRRQVAQDQKQLDLARARGYGDDVARMLRASNGTGDATSKRKPVSCKASDSTQIRINSEKTGKPVKATRTAMQGDFILYGARTKEGQLENRKGLAHEPKAWRQGYDKAAYETGIGMHDATNGAQARK